MVARRYFHFATSEDDEDKKMYAVAEKWKNFRSGHRRPGKRSRPSGRNLLHENSDRRLDRSNLFALDRPGFTEGRRCRQPEQQGVTKRQSSDAGLMTMHCSWVDDSTALSLKLDCEINENSRRR